MNFARARGCRALNGKTENQQRAHAVAMGDPELGEI
jgi:hypothetical protein